MNSLGFWFEDLIKKTISRFKRSLFRIYRYFLWKMKGTYVAFGSHVSIYTKIGRYSRINKASYIDDCEIGDFVACGGGLVVRPLNHALCYPNMQSWLQSQIIKSNINIDTESKGKVIIQSASWIGDSVIMVSGASVGYGAVIGAGAVVTSHIPDFAIAVGVPAKVVKYRLNEDCRKFLLQLRWWDWSIEKIHANKLFFETDLTKLSKSQLEDLKFQIK